MTKVPPDAFKVVRPVNGKASSETGSSTWSNTPPRRGRRLVRAVANPRKIAHEVRDKYSPRWGSWHGGSGGAIIRGVRPEQRFGNRKIPGPARPRRAGRLPVGRAFTAAVCKQNASASPSSVRVSFLFPARRVEAKRIERPLIDPRGMTDCATAVRVRRQQIHVSPMPKRRWSMLRRLVRRPVRRMPEIIPHSCATTSMRAAARTGARPECSATRPAAAGKRLLALDRNAKGVGAVHRGLFPDQAGRGASINVFQAVTSRARAGKSSVPFGAFKTGAGHINHIFGRGGHALVAKVARAPTSASTPGATRGPGPQSHGYRARSGWRRDRQGESADQIKDQFRPRIHRPASAAAAFLRGQQLFRGNTASVACASVSPVGRQSGYRVL